VVLADQACHGRRGSATIKEVGGWKTPAVVQRYAHLAPGHLHAAVERLVPRQQESAVELARN
jgi:hypothetical protein